MSLSIFYFSIMVIAGAIVQLLASSTGSVAAALITAALISVISHALWSFSELCSRELKDELVPAGGAAAGILAGTLIRFLQAGTSPLNWIAIPVGLLMSGVSIWLRSGAQSETCFQHRVRLTTVFQCPRCRQK